MCWLQIANNDRDFVLLKFQTAPHQLCTKGPCCNDAAQTVVSTVTASLCPGWQQRHYESETSPSKNSELEIIWEIEF